MMQQVDFSQIGFNEEQSEYKQQLLKRLANDDIIKQWLKLHKVDFAFVEKYSGRFNDYALDAHKCANCQGLAYCHQYQKGIRQEIYVDNNHLQSMLVKCEYLLVEEEKTKHRKYYRQADFDPSYLKIDLRQLDHGQNIAYKKSLIQVLQCYENKIGLYLFGDVGSGKSYMSAALCNEYAKNKQKVAFVNVPRFISNLKLSFGNDEEMRSKLKKLELVDVLVLDDIGGESVSLWSRDDILLPILDYRMNNNKITIFTSNYSIKTLEEKYKIASGNSIDSVGAKRIIERITTLAKEIYLNGASKRNKY